MCVFVCVVCLPKVFVWQMRVSVGGEARNVKAEGRGVTNEPTGPHLTGPKKGKKKK